MGFFAGYIILTAFSAVSLITGIISEALLMAQVRDEEIRLQQLEEERSDFSIKLMRVLGNLDADGSGTLTSDEVKAVFEQDHQLLRKLSVLDIGISESEFLDLIDRL